MKSNRPVVIITAVILVAILSIASVCVYNWEFRHEDNFMGLSLGMPMDDVKGLFGDEISEIIFKGGIDFGIPDDLPPLFPEAEECIVVNDYPIMTYSGKLILLFDGNRTLYGALYCPENFVCTPDCGNVVYEYFRSLYGKAEIYGGGEMIRSISKGTQLIFHYDRLLMVFTITADEKLAVCARDDSVMFFILCDSTNIKGVMSDPDFSTFVDAVSSNSEDKQYIAADITTTNTYATTLLP